MLSCVWLFCDRVDCSPPGSSVHWIFQARILEWVAISSSRGSSWPRDWTYIYSSTLDASLDARDASLLHWKMDSLPLSHLGSPKSSLNLASLDARDASLLHWKMDSLPLSHPGSPKSSFNIKTQVSSVQFSCSVVSDSLRPHGLQHARLPVYHQLPELAQTHTQVRERLKS